MATTSPDNLRTPDPGDPYNLVPDLATLAGDVQSALLLRDNITGSGTASQRTAFTSTAPDGFLWQDTDGIKMIWRKDGAVWVPAVWRWSGTSVQMNSISPPDGFKWRNTTNNVEYIRAGGSWKVFLFRDTLTPTISGGGQTSGWFYAADTSYTFPSGLFSTTPQVSLFVSGTGFLVSQAFNRTSSGFTYGVARLGAAPASNTRVELSAWDSI